MSEHRPLPIGTVTFVFTDIEGSTLLVQGLGDGYPPLLEAHNRILREAIEANRGIPIKTDGDAFFAVFTDPADAVTACVEGQVELGSNSWPNDGQVRVRMGIHTGAGTLGGPDYVGLDVHRASRIADSAHGGQVVLSEATAVLVERTLPSDVELLDLGKHRLKDLSEPESIFQVLALGLHRDFPPLRTLDAIPNNLPLQVTSFVGREQTLRQALDLLASTRLLTLTGPGGTGKTRLSLQVAAESSEAFPDGVFFVGLSPVIDPDTVPSSVLAAFGEQASDRERAPRQMLLEHIAGRKMLVVLDNFEQVLPAASLVAEMIRSAPDSKFVVTSRAPLHLSGEQEMPVPPLGIPDAGEGTQRSEAVDLFVERAMAVRPDFELDDSNRADVARLVTRLDGLPLAIELVASRVRLLPVAEILSRLDSKMLASGSVDLPERQRTIEGAIDWSHDLLDARHQRLFARMSVFAGGARLDEIEAVCGGEEIGLDVLDGLTGLIDQSLVGVGSGETGNRFRMLHVIREYAAARLTESGEGDEIRHRHLEAYVAMVEGLTAEFLRVDRKKWFDVMEADHDNIRAALDWGIGRDVDLSLRLASATWRFWQARGHLHEAQRWIEAALAHQGGDTANVAKALEALGGILWWQGELAQCLEAYRRALALQRELGDPEEIGNALYNVGITTSSLRENEEEVFAALNEAQAIFEELGDENGLGNVEWARGTHAVNNREFELAITHLVRAADHYRNVGNEFGRGWALFEIGGSHLRLGDAERAWPHIREGLSLFAGHEDVSAVVLFLYYAAGVAAERGDRGRALRIAGAFHGLRIRTGANLATADVNALEGLEYEDLEALEGEDAAIYAEGKSMTVEQAVAYTLGEPEAG